MPNSLEGYGTTSYRRSNSGISGNERFMAEGNKIQKRKRIFPYSTTSSSVSWWSPFFFS
jgi:hypothetical protein